jgi:glycosyltransferase involved in cell wall biosynthesis
MPVLWFDEVQGGWTYFKEEAVRLTKLGHQMIVVCPHPGRSEFEGVRIHRCRSYWVTGRGFVINPFSFFACMGKVFRETGMIDLVYDDTSGLYPMGFALWLWFKLRRRKTPIVCHVHGELKDLSNRGLLSAVFEFYLNVVARLEYLVANKVVISGEKVRRRVVSLGANPKKVVVVPYGLKYDGPVKEEPRHTDRSFIVGFVGRPSRAKGLDSIIRGFALAGLPDASLVVVGDGQEIGLMQSLAKSLEVNAVFLHYRHDVPNLLRSFDVFANMSLSEGGISGSQIEAMQAGLPTIVTPFSHMITTKDAMIVNDPEGFAEALKILYSDSVFRKHLAAASKRKGDEIAKMYSWDTYLEGIQRVFKEVMA